VRQILKIKPIVLEMAVVQIPVYRRVSIDEHSGKRRGIQLHFSAFCAIIKVANQQSK
jgi:hypothetical protein